MIQPRTRLAALAVSGVVVATALVGCSLAEGTSSAGGGGADTSPVAATTQEIDVDDFAAQLRSGLETVDTAQLTVSSTGSILEGTATGPLDLSGESPELSLATDGSGSTGMLGGPAELILVDGQGYVKAPIVTGKKYADLDALLRHVGPMLGSMGGSMGGAGGHGLPDSLGAVLKGLDVPAAVEKGAEHAESVELVGTESVDDVDLEHYTLSFAHDGDEKTVDTWLDEDGVPVRTESESPMGSGEISVELSDLGEPVDISAPAPSQVTRLDLGDLLKGFSAFGGTTSG